MRKIQPLTPEEQLYAEKHHEMLYHFLSHYQLDETEYFDVVVFGYLAAIQEYFRKPHAAHIFLHSPSRGCAGGQPL